MITHDVFISYSWKDRRCADRVERILSAHGIRTWMDRRNNRAGDVWSRELEIAIRNSELVLLLSSHNSNHSTWVRHEIEAALRLNRRIVPFQLGNDVPIEGVAQTVADRGFHRIVAPVRPREADLERLAKDVKKQLDRPVPDNIPSYTTHAFVGREGYLRRLLKSGDRILLSGISGVGKTEIALQFAMRYKDLFKGGVFVANWADSDFASELTLFCESKLHLTAPNLLGRIEKVKWIWCNWSQPGQALVVVNDPDFGDLPEVLPHPNSQFKVIVCSQAQQALGMERIHVDPLSAAESLKLMSKLIGRPRIRAEGQAARDICRWSGGLPLALDAIGRYLERNTSDSLGSYRDRLVSAGISQIAFQENPGKTREKTLNRAFELSWMRLSDAGKEVGWFLGRLAFTPISKGFFAPIDVDAGWDNLLHWHFLRPSEPDLYEIHHGRLHEFLGTTPLDQMLHLPGLLLKVLGLRARHLLKSVCTPELAILTGPHLEHVASRQRLGSHPKDYFLLLNAAAKCYELQGLHSRAESAAQRALNCFTRLPKQRRTANSLHELWDLDHRMRVAQIGQGYYFRAVRGLRALEEKTAQRLPRALQKRVWSSLGDASRLLGKLDESAKAYKRALELSKDDAERGEALYRLARIERLLGNHTEAGGLYGEAEEALPAGTHAHAYCLFGIAEVARLTRDYQFAMGKYEAALEQFRRLHHKEGEAYALWGTGEMRRWHRDFDGALRDHQESERLCLEVGDKRSQVWAVFGIAEVWRAMGDAERSKLEYERGLRVLTDNRPEEDCEPTEAALGRLGLAASLRLLGKGSAKNCDFSYRVYRRQNMAYYEVQCLVERALSRDAKSAGFERDIAMAERICRAKAYRFELEEIARIRDRPDLTWIHELNPA